MAVSRNVALLADFAEVLQIGGETTAKFLASKCEPSNQCLVISTTIERTI